MDVPELTGYPTGGPDDWRARYAPVIEADRGEAIDGAAVTAIVVTWEGGASELGGSLRAIDRASKNVDGPVEVIVVDNAAPASLADEHAGYWDRWIRFDYNLNLSPARNLGVVSASADVVAFIDDDGRVQPDYFTEALPYFDDPNIAAIRGRVVADGHPWFTLLATHYDRGPEPIDDALVTEGASFVRRDAFIDAGGFPDEVMGHEGIELTYRLTRKFGDAQTLYVPDVVLRHDYLDSWEAFFTKQLRYAENEAVVGDRSPEVAQFMEECFSRSYPSRDLTLEQWLVRTGLRALRNLLQAGGRLFYRLRQSSSDQSDSTS